VADLRAHLADATGSAAAFDGLWAAMQRSLGERRPRPPARMVRRCDPDRTVRLALVRLSLVCAGPGSHGGTRAAATASARP